MFYVHHTDYPLPYTGYIPYDILFETEDEARDWCRRNGFSDHIPYPASWRQREKWRTYLSGERQTPPWDLDPIDDHFAFISQDDPTKIAFTPDERYGKEDRQLRMKPGKYVRQFYPNLTAKQVTFYAEWWRRGDRPAIAMPELKLKFAKTAKEIVSVYDRGPGSCMSKLDYVRVYAAGDLAVAYFEEGQDVVARALCWPAKKVFGRVYPTPEEDDEESERLQSELFERLRQVEGYTHISENSQCFDGARLKAIRSDAGAGYWVMPYLDNQYGVVGPKGGYFRMQYNNAEIRGCETCGCIYKPYNKPCGECGKKTAPNQMVTLWRYRPRARRWDTTRQVCSNCCPKVSFYDALTNHQVDQRYDTSVNVRQGFASLRYITAHGDYYHSDFSNYWFEDAGNYRKTHMANGQVWSRHEFLQNGFTCMRTGERWPIGDKYLIPDGSLWSKQAVEKYSFDVDDPPEYDALPEVRSYFDEDHLDVLYIRNPKLYSRVQGLS